MMIAESFQKYAQKGMEPLKKFKNFIKRFLNF
jgi:hypothetical protein